MAYTTSLVLSEVTYCYAKRGISVHVWWTLCLSHNIFFLREEEGSVLDKGFVNKMRIQVLMAGADEGGRNGLLCWHFDEILFQHSPRDNKDSHWL